MSRAERLLDLVQCLRRHRRPVSGQVLATELGVSLRTLYRDIATLQGQGADIEGEPGLGYVLRPGFMLPPLMFTEDEIEALVLGARWVAARADSELSRGAANMLAKIASVLPEDLKARLDNSSLLVAPARQPEEVVDLAIVRKAIRNEHVLAIEYGDADGQTTQRNIWPIALGYFEKVKVAVAWCEMRGDFRHFRADRIRIATPTGQRYPRRKPVLLKEWRTRIGIPDKNDTDKI